MKKTNNKYLLFGLIGLVVVGAVVVLTQSSGQLFQGALIKTLSPTTTSTTSPTYSTSTVQVDYLGMIQNLEKRVLALETANTALQNKINTTNATLTQTNTAVAEVKGDAKEMLNYFCAQIFSGYDIYTCEANIDYNFSMDTTSY